MSPTSPWRKFVRNCLSWLTPELVVFEFGVDLEPIAGGDHHRFAHGFIVAQRNERLTHAVGRERMALPDFDRRRVVAET